MALVKGPGYLIGWAVVATIATGVGVGTVVLVRDAVVGSTVVSTLSQQDVLTQLSAAARSTASRPTGAGPTGSAGVISTSQRPTRSPTARSTARPTGQSPRPAVASSGPTPSVARGGGSHPPGSPGPSPSGVTRLLSSPGGIVVARCDSPADGAAVYLVSWSPAQGYAVHEVIRGPAQDVEISFESGSGSVKVHVQCMGGGPVQLVETSSGGGADR